MPDTVVIIIGFHKKIGDFWQEKTGKSAKILARGLLIQAGLSTLLTLYFCILEKDYIKIGSCSTVSLLIGYLYILVWSSMDKTNYTSIEEIYYMVDHVFLIGCTTAWMFSLSGLLCMPFIIFNAEKMEFFQASFMFLELFSFFSALMISIHKYNPPKKKETIREKIKKLLARLKPVPQPLTNSTS